MPRNPMVPQVRISSMSPFVTLCAFRPLVRETLSRERRLRRELGKQAERRENENGEDRQRESYQSDLNSLITVVVRFVRTFDRHTQILGLRWS